jgi:hypothetical protein
MKKNKIDFQNANDAFISLIRDPDQEIVLDANFFIPPDRSGQILTLKPMPFEFFESEWIEPVFQKFSNISIHEAVYEEITLNSTKIKMFVDKKVQSSPSELKILIDSSLTDPEKALRNGIERYVAIPTNYDPSINNRDDKGEVKSLSYMVAKGIIYFCSHDANALNLIENAEALGTKLDSVQAVHTYEIIYYLSKFISNRKKLKGLYKYMYFLSCNDRKANCNWGDFIDNMDKLYLSYF